MRAFSSLCMMRAVMKVLSQSLLKRRFSSR